MPLTDDTAGMTPRRQPMRRAPCTMAKTKSKIKNKKKTIPTKTMRINAKARGAHCCSQEHLSWGLQTTSRW
ncbi:MAG TPA: hypothetical protein VF573_28740 [Paraburkholderia sp.]|uniref:hypothetical protein n=1 Tax=Paraburkholderia sp. TaxID=1926495 RepID=UPI002ED56D1D